MPIILDGKTARVRHVLGEDHPETLDSLNDMGFLLQKMGKLDEALPYYQEALEGMRRVLGDDHPSTLDAIGNMGTLLRSIRVHRRTTRSMVACLYERARGVGQFRGLWCRKGSLRRRHRHQGGA